MTGRRGSEANDERGADGFDFSIEPGAARGLFAGSGLLVDAALAARFPLEVLDGVGDVDEIAIDARLDETAIEERSSGSDEGLAFKVFAVAGLLANEDEAGVGIALAEDSLGGVLPERAAAAAAGGFAQSFQGVAFGQEVSGGCLRSGNGAGHIF